MARNLYLWNGKFLYCIQKRTIIRVENFAIPTVSDSWSHIEKCESADTCLKTQKKKKTNRIIVVCVRAIHHRQCRLSQMRTPRLYRPVFEAKRVVGKQNARDIDHHLQYQKVAVDAAAAAAARNKYTVKSQLILRRRYAATCTPATWKTANTTA